MSFTILLAGLAIILFFIYFFYTGAKRSSYLLYVAISLPLLDMGVSSFALGAFTVFDAVTYLSVILLFRDFFMFRKRNVHYFILFLIFISLLFLSSLYSEFPFQSLLALLSILTPFIYTRFLLKELFENPNFLPVFLKYLKISCLVGIVFIGMQMLFGMKFTFYAELNPNVMGLARYPGFFMDSQLNGLFLAMMSYLFLLHIGKPTKPKLKHYLFFGLVAVAVILAGSRSGLLGLAIGLLILLIMVGGNFRINTVTMGMVGATVLLVFASAFPLFSRFDDVDDSLSFRASIWDGAWEIFKKHFNLGVGYNNYKDYVSVHAQDQYLLLDNDEMFFLDAPENGYLKFLTEFGFFASLLLFIIILLPILNVFFHFLRGKKVRLAFFFMAPILCWFVSLTTFHSSGDSRIVTIVCTFLTLMIAYPTDPIIVNEASAK